MRPTPWMSRSITHLPSARTRAAMGQSPVGEGQASLPQSHVPQAIPPVGRVLWHLPQSSLARGIEWVQVASRPKTTTTPSAFRACRATASPASTTPEGPDELQRLPHALGRNRTGCEFRCRRFCGDGRSLGAQPPVLGRQHGHLASQPRQMPDADAAIEAHREFNEGVMRVDLFGLREEGRIDGKLIAPLRPEVPQIEPGSTWLLETVIRTVKMGHVFTQGTSDSNEVWLEVTVFDGERELWKSGGMDDFGAVDPWAHFVNAFVIDRDGNRIDRRNAEDIYIPLYNTRSSGRPTAFTTDSPSLRMPLVPSWSKHDFGTASSTPPTCDS